MECQRSQERPQTAPDPFKIPPKPCQMPPKPSQNRPNIDPKGLLEPILGQCFKKARLLTPKKRPNGLQERPREAPDRPRPSQNEVQEPPKSDFSAIFCDLFRDCKFDGILKVFFQ